MPEARLSVLLIDAFADWEIAHLAAALRTYFEGDVRYLSPRGRPVTSMGGLSVTPHGAIESFRVDDCDGLVLIGSPHWDDAHAPIVGAPLAQAAEAGKLIGAICGATLPVARAGLLNDRRHTSNALDFLQKNAVAYDGARYYEDGPCAVRDGPVVTAPGSAPVTFALAVLEGLLPQHKAAIADFARLCAHEHLARQPVPAE